MIDNETFRRVRDTQDILLYRADTGFDKDYDKLEPGTYRLSIYNQMFTNYPMFSKIPYKEELIQFKNGVIGDFAASVEEFFSENTVNVYKELKINHKIGYIFYGKPGTGKTSLCFLAMKILSEKYQAICLDCTGIRLDQTIWAIRKLRDHQDNPVVIFYDEFEERVEYDENKFLPFLDGNDSVERSIFLGCTNFIEKIPDRIKNRKSRIKYCYQIDSLPFEVYNQYLITKLGSESKERIAEFAFKAEESKLTIDQLKNAVLDYKLAGMTIQDSIKEAKLVFE